MVLKNYYKILAYNFMSDNLTVPFSLIQENESFHLIEVNGTHCVPKYMNNSGNYYIGTSLITGDSNLFTNNTNGSMTNGSFVVGSGTTKATIDDYCLENEIRTLTKVSHTVNNFNLTENLGSTLQITKKYVNETDNDITIGEIGYFRRAGGMNKYNGSSWTGGNYQSAGTASILLVREVLDEPLVVPAGQGATVTLNITFNGFEVLSSSSATTE